MSRESTLTDAAILWSKVLVLLFGPLGLFILLMLSLEGCAAPKAYVEADRAVFDVVAPEWADYFGNDAALSLEQKERRRRLIRGWAARIKAEEAK